MIGRNLDDAEEWLRSWTAQASPRPRCDKVAGPAERIMVIDWTGSFDHMRSRAYLMKEYWRRAAW
jgi:hypothetical protein